jgi:peptidoglycan/xylan/chitin deacetylase (PgdA/CDA1 family)
MFEKNRNEVLGIMLQRYPSFVLSKRVSTLDSIPSFVFHDVAPDQIAAALQFLAHNRYSALNADEYCQRLLMGEKDQARAVMLTFDDGYQSLYKVVYPALKQFGLKAVAYIVPGLLSADENHRSRVSGKSLCTWREIREMHESGLVDIESHSMYHHAVPISSRVVDFVRPGINLAFSEPVFACGTVGGTQTEPPYGTPIYYGSPRAAKLPAFREDPSVIRACIDYVNTHGGPEFFVSQDWHLRLRSVLSESRRFVHTTAGRETKGEQWAALLKDFMESKRQIEQRLPGKVVRHFCYPWFQGSALAFRASAEAGYISNAWGSLVPRFSRAARMPIAVARFSPEYIWRLPGKGRKPLTAIISQRWTQARIGFLGVNSR